MTRDGQVLNPGSLGQPKDGDPRAAFVLIEDGVARLERATHPVQRTIARVRGLETSPAAAETLAEMLRTGRAPRSGLAGSPGP